MPLSDSKDSQARKVACPRCRQPAIYATSNRWRPFCSERCRQTDLGAWASESYRVAAATPTDGEEGDPPNLPN